MAYYNKMHAYNRNKAGGVVGGMPRKHNGWLYNIKQQLHPPVHFRGFGLFSL